MCPIQHLIHRIHFVLNQLPFNDSLELFGRFKMNRVSTGEGGGEGVHVALNVSSWFNVQWPTLWDGSNQIQLMVHHFTISF